MRYVMLSQNACELLVALLHLYLYLGEIVN